MRSRLDKWILTALCLVAPVFSAAAALAAELTIGLSAAAVEVDRLAGDSPSATADFQVSDATQVIFDVWATAGGVAVTLTLPDATMIDETSVTSIGGEAERTEVSPGGTNFLILPNLQPGHHVLFAIPNPQSGTWRLTFSQPSGSVDEIAVVTQMLLDSETQVGVAALPGEVVLGGAVTLTAAAFSGSTPVEDASVTATLVLPGGGVQDLTLLDNGLPPDHLAGDGLYATALIPAASGEHRALAKVSGVTPSGTPFVRQAASEFEVVPPTSALLGSVSAQGVDSNFNGLFDQLVLGVSLDVLVAGEFLVSAQLTRNGASVRESTRLVLAVGQTTAPVAFTADQIVNLGGDGPYAIGPVEVTFLGAAGARPSDRKEDAGETPAFTLSQFEQRPIRYLGTFTETPFDGDGDGLFDRLDVGLSMFLAPIAFFEFYEWSALLLDGEGNEIGFFMGFFRAGGTSPGAGVQVLPLQFAGAEIGRNGLDGPYRIASLLVRNEAGDSLLLQTVGFTSALRAKDFEAYRVCNIDRTGGVDGADVALILARADAAVLPGALGDRNGDGVLSVLDSRQCALDCDEPECQPTQ